MLSKYQFVLFLLGIAIGAQISSSKEYEVSNHVSIGSFLQKDEQNVSDTDADASKAEKGVEADSSDETEDQEELDEGEVSAGIDSDSDIPGKIEVFLQQLSFSSS